jgi:prephenate dehydrogenase
MIWVPAFAGMSGINCRGGQVAGYRLGLFGFGAFGRLAVRHLAPYFDILVHDPSPKAVRQMRRWNVTPATLEEAAACPVVVLGAPVGELKVLAARVAPHVRPGALVIDVASVKMGPARWLAEALPNHVDIIGTHPLFGPQSARAGLTGLEIVICPVRGERVARLTRFLERVLLLKVSLTTPEAHDRALAAVQGLTHMIAKVMSGLEPLPRTHTTVSYDQMMQALSLVQGDSDELFLAIERENPFAAELRQRFFAEIDTLRLRLETHID